MNACVLGRTTRACLCARVHVNCSTYIPPSPLRPFRQPSTRSGYGRRRWATVCFLFVVYSGVRLYVIVHKCNCGQIETKSRTSARIRASADRARITPNCATERYIIAIAAGLEWAHHLCDADMRANVVCMWLTCLRGEND